jgi:hypothetical protein
MDTNLNGVSSLDQLADMLEDAPRVEEPQDEPVVEEAAEEALPEQGEQAEPAAEDDGLVEAEYEGKAYKVPKELKEALLRQADYTQKTQQVAEQRKAVEEKAQLLERQMQVASITFDKAVELRDVENRLSQFKTLDWQSLADSDPVQATKLNFAYQQLQQQYAEKQQALYQAQAEAEQLSAQQRQQMLVHAQQELRTRLPDFNAQTAEQIKSVGKVYGFTDAELASVIDPRHVHVLHDAMKWRALQADKPKAMQKVSQAPVAVKPAAQAPKPRTNQAALDRLKTNGRVEDLAAFL